VHAIGLLYVIQVREERGHDDEWPDEESEERQAEELLATVVNTEKYDGEGLELDLQEGVDEADVKVECKHDRLLEIESKGAHEDADREVGRGHGCRRNLRGGDHRRVARGLAQAAASAVEGVEGGGLGEEEQDERRAREAHRVPDCSAPALEVRREAPEQRAQARRRRSEDAPDGYPVRALFAGSTSARRSRRPWRGLESQRIPRESGKPSTRCSWSPERLSAGGRMWQV